MKVERRRELAQKGWREDELRRAEEILDRATAHDLFFSKIVFWSALLVIVFANLTVALILIPFLIALDTGFLYGIIAVLAITIGFLYNFLITDIGLLEKKHHRIASVIVPLIGAGNAVIMVLISNRFVESLQLNLQPHNPWIVAAIFAGAFILPYVADQIRMMLK